MDTFYVIKLINNNTGVRGYVIDTPKGIMISTEGIVSDITQFKTYQDAQAFMREKKLERGGVKAYIRDNGDLMKEMSETKGISPMKTDMFYLENMAMEKLFYDAKQEGYYFDKRDVGYCVWQTEEQLLEFVKVYAEKSDWTGKVFIKKVVK